MAVVAGQDEADVPAPLPAAADLPEPSGHAGHEESQAAQQNGQRQNQDQDEGRGQAEVVACRVEGTVPAKEERVQSGHGQGAVTYSGLEEGGDGCHVGKVAAQ